MCIESGRVKNQVILYLSLTLFCKWVKLLMVRLREKACAALTSVFSTTAEYYPPENSKPSYVKLCLMLTSTEIFARVSMGPLSLQRRKEHEVLRDSRCSLFSQSCVSAAH